MYTVVAALHPVHHLLELRTLWCCPVKSQLCGSEDPAQPLSQSPRWVVSSSTSLQEITPWLGSAQDEGLQPIPGLLSTPACPLDWPSVFSQPQRVPGIGLQSALNPSLCPGLAFSPPVPASWGAADFTSGKIKMPSRRLALSSPHYLLRFP